MGVPELGEELRDGVTLAEAVEEPEELTRNLAVISNRNNLN